MILRLVRLFLVFAFSAALPLAAQEADDTTDTLQVEIIDSGALELTTEMIEAAEALPDVFDDYDSWNTFAERAGTSVAQGRASNGALAELRGDLADWRDVFLGRQSINSGRINDSTNAISASGLTLNLSSSMGANVVRTTADSLTADTTGGTSDTNDGLTLVDTAGGLTLNTVNAGAGAVDIDAGGNAITFTANTVTSGDLKLTGSTLTDLNLATLATTGALVAEPSVTSSVIGLGYLINDPLSKIGNINLFNFEVFGYKGQDFLVIVGLILFLYLIISRILRYDSN